MTTIAYDGKTLAADTRISEGDFFSFTHKIFRTDNGGVFAGAGNWGLVNRLHDSLNKKNHDVKKLFTKKELEKIDGLYIDPDGRALYMDQSYHGWLDVDSKYIALGSGKQIAWAFLMAGYSPKEAIKATAKVRSCTNDLVDVYDCKTQAFKLVTFPE